MLLFFCFCLQISDKNLIDLIRRKVKLNHPYAGVFLKRDDEYDCFFTWLKISHQLGIVNKTQVLFIVDN